MLDKSRSDVAKYLPQQREQAWQKQWGKKIMLSLTDNLANFSPYELVFGRKPKLLLNLETMPDIKVSGTFKDYYDLLNERLQYLFKLLQGL